MNDFDPGRHSKLRDDQEPELVQEAFIDYGDAAEYYGLDGNTMALKAFGEDFKKRGVFYLVDREGDVSYEAVSHGDGLVMTYRMLRDGELQAAGSSGLNGRVVSREEAGDIARVEIADYDASFSNDFNRDDSLLETDK